MRRLLFALTVLCSLSSLARVRAHDGPPFPVLEDHRAGPYLVSIWSDPDIGTGEVYVMVQAADGRALPSDTRVRVGIRPLSARVPETQYGTELQSRETWWRYFTSVTFDRGERFRVRAQVTGTRGQAEASAEVLATPDAEVGLFGLVISLLPFVGVALLWGRAALKRRASST